MGKDFVTYQGKNDCQENDCTAFCLWLKVATELLKGKVEWGKTTPLRTETFFPPVKQKVKCVPKSYHSFSDTDINFKQSMKNIQFSCF